MQTGSKRRVKQFSWGPQPQQAPLWRDVQKVALQAVQSTAKQTPLGHANFQHSVAMQFGAYLRPALLEYNTGCV